MHMHDQSFSRTSGRTLVAVSAMCVRALRIAVLKYAGNFPRCVCLDLNAENIQRVNYFIRAKGKICRRSQYSNAGAAGCVPKISDDRQWCRVALFDHLVGERQKGRGNNDA